jgi:serine/threonine-protein kinase HipA
METPVFVHLDFQGETILVGTLWLHQKQGRQTTSFEYAESYRKRPGHFSLEPALMVTAGRYHTPTPFFGAINDSAPDRWGRKLIQRLAFHQAKAENRAPRTLMESDYLLMVDDRSRQGALRFFLKKNGPYLGRYSDTGIPPLIQLGRLLQLSSKVLKDEESGADIRYLVEPGSSLGGARPKAAVRDNQGNLLLAKFPSPHDDWDVELWEAVAFILAGHAGIDVPETRLVTVSDHNILLIQRFDRQGLKRIPFLSAMSMLGASDGDTASYLEIGEALIAHGASPEKDLRELWKRIVFNILTSNVDDHLRNHGFLYENLSGWGLSPIYDLEPTPVHVKPRFLSTRITLDDATASLDLAYEVAEEFGLDSREARTLAAQVGAGTSKWHQVAQRLGAGRSEIESMHSAFEHEDLNKALMR